MGFVQIVQFRTSRRDELDALVGEFRRERSASGDSGLVRVLACKDRDQPNQYVTVAEFASYEEAMANSNAPETQAFAARMAELCDGPPTFLNLDVLEAFSG